MTNAISNAHTHLELTQLDFLCPQKPVEFSHWVLTLLQELKNRSERAIDESIERGIAELKSCGTTHVGDITASWRSVRPLFQSGLAGVAYLEVLGNTPKQALARLEEAQKKILEFRTHFKDHSLQVGLSLHSPYSCHPDLLKLGAVWCREQQIPLAIHAAESPGESLFLLGGEESPLGWNTNFLSLITPHLSVPQQRPIPYLASLGVLEARPLLIHAIQVTDEDIRLIADSGSSVVHCPRSNENLSCGRMPLEKYLQNRISLYLGTDSRASSPDLDVREEVKFAKKLHAGKVSAEEIELMLHRSLE